MGQVISDFALIQSWHGDCKFLPSNKLKLETMKKAFFTILSITILTLTYGQAIKTEKEKFKLVYAGAMKGGPYKSGTLFSDHVIISVPNKLDIEADSVRVDGDRTVLTAYGTINFTFNGKIVFGKENNRICRFRLGGDTLRIE